METLRICLWSGPRNVSTALMYSFGQRSDTRVVDEPLYAHYLRVSGAEHPGRDEVLAAQDNDGAEVVRKVVFGPCDRPVLFVKQMAHHLVDLDLGFIDRTVNVLLIRDPAEMVRSYEKVAGIPRLEDVGLGVQSALFDDLTAKGKSPPVLDSRALLLDPPGVLHQLCDRLGIPFDLAMLSWPPGSRPEDGVWESCWYASVHRSTGFAAYTPKSGPVPPRLQAIFEECRPHYERLYAHALKADA